MKKRSTLLNSPLMTPSTRLRMKNDPKTISDAKYSHARYEPELSSIYNIPQQEGQPDKVECQNNPQETTKVFQTEITTKNRKQPRNKNEVKQDSDRIIDTRPSLQGQQCDYSQDSNSNVIKRDDVIRRIGCWRAVLPLRGACMTYTEHVSTQRTTR